MEQLEKLIEHIIKRVNLSLREFKNKEPHFEASLYLENMTRIDDLLKYYAYYGIWSHHPLQFYFNDSNLGGTYFLGRCEVDHSVLYNCDVRGDELKEKGAVFKHGDEEVIIKRPEIIRIRNCFLVKTLVHNYSHWPEEFYLYLIKNTISAPYANIHGSPTDGCFLGAFSTVDLTHVHDCIIGRYAYVQVGDLSHCRVESGRVWIRVPDDNPGGYFEFNYQHDINNLEQYVSFEPGRGVSGKFMELVDSRKVDLQELYEVVDRKHQVPVPETTHVNRYAMLIGRGNQIGENVLISQRAFIENATLGKGANAQENCYIGFSNLKGYNVTAHGASISYSELGERTFVGFNSYLLGKPTQPLLVGEQCIIAPHTIIDLEESVTVPPRHLVWGYIRNARDLEEHSMSLEELAEIETDDEGIKMGAMEFKGSGKLFVNAFQSRIEHILKDNGALYDGTDSTLGHAQKGQEISFNIMQPYREGAEKGIYPTIYIRSSDTEKAVR
ncbi:transferase [Desulfococcaceae bacterium HSG8]|nr:transferase [Desulfococcaceae bacterium HSG8]